MRLVSIVAIAALLGLALGGVVDTTDATFDQVIQGDLVLMEFYAPWCGHCKKLEPEYEKAAAQIGDLAVLAKLDATVEKASAAKFDIKGFPTIKIFRNGVLSGDYEGGRTTADFVKYVKGNVGPAVSPLNTAQAIAEFKTSNAVAVFAQFTSVADPAFEIFEGVAKSLRHSFAFAVVTDASLFDGESGSIVVYKHFDDKREVYAGEIQHEALAAFVTASGTPLFDEIGPANYKMYMERKIPIAWFFATPADTQVMSVAKEVAPKFKGKLSFVWIDSSKYAGMAQRLGLKGDKFPALALDHEGQHFAFPSHEFDTITVEKFVDQFVAGTLEPTLRSEESPEPHTVDGLTTVVGKTFKSLVEDADTDVFIEFYAPWCGHCKQLAPVFEALAKNFKESPVRIAKIDATANDFDQKKFNVQGFPTMFFIPKDTHVPVVYEGGRTEEAFTTFIKSKIDTV